MIRSINKVSLKVVSAQFLIQEKNDIFNMPSEISRVLVLFLPKTSFDFLQENDRLILEKNIIKDMSYLKDNFSQQCLELSVLENTHGQELVPFVLNNTSKKTDQKTYLDIFRYLLLKKFNVDLYDYKYNPLKANIILSALVSRGLQIETRVMKWYETRIGPSGAEKDIKLS